MDSGYLVRKFLGSTRRLLLFLLLIAFFLFLGVGVAYFTFARAGDEAAILPSNPSLPATGDNESEIGDLSQKLTVNAQLQVNGQFLLAPSSVPQNAKAGTLVFDQTTSTLQYYNGTEFVPLTAQQAVPEGGVTALQGQTGAITLTPGAGIAINGTTISNSGILGVNGVPGDINVTTANGIASLSLPQSIAPSSSPTFNGLSLANALGVAYGGTGAANFTANGVLIGNGTGAFGTVTAVAPGQCLISTAGAPQFGACAGGGSGVSTLNSLSGNLTLANASGVGTTITINDASTSAKGIAQFNASNFSVASGLVNTIQNIGTAATPTFGGLTLSSPLDVSSGGTGRSSLTANGLLYGNGTGAAQSLAVGTTGQCLIATTGAAPSWSACPGDGVGIAGLNLAGTSGTPQSLTDGDTITIAAGSNITTTAGATDTLTVAVVSNPSFNSLTLSTALGLASGGTGSTTPQGAINAISGLTTNGDLLYHDGTNATRLARGTNGQCLLSTGTTIQWSTCTGAGGVSSVNGFSGVVTVQGTSNQVIVNNNAGTITLSTPQDINTSSSPTFAGLTLSAPLGVTSGGTGAASLTAGGILFGNGTGAITASAVLTNGQLLIGDGTGAPTAAALTQGSGIQITNGAGSITVAVDSTVCTTSGNCAGVGGTGDIVNNGQTGPVTIGTNNATSTVLETSNIARLTIDSAGAATFSGSLTVTGAATFNGNLTVQLGDTFTVNGDAFTDLTGDGLQVSTGALGVDATVCRTSGNCVGGGGGGAPNGAPYLTVGNDATLSSERAITAGTNLSSVDGGANGSFTLNVINNPTFSGLLTANGGLTVEVGDTFTFNGDAFTDLTGTGLTISGGALQSTLGTSVDLTAEVSGILPIANGGTNAATAQGAINNIAGLTTQGDLLYHDGTNTTRLARGTNGQCLLSNGSTILWSTCTGDGVGVTSVGLIDSQTASSNGAVISGITLYLQSASITNPGLVNTTTQSFAGLKTFTDGLTVTAGQVFTVNGDAFTDLTGTGLTISGGALQTTLGTSVDLTGEVTGTLPVTNGGTGVGSFTANGILYGNGSGALGVTAAGTTGQCLLATTGSAPSWGTCTGDGSGVTTVGVLDGGTYSANGASISGTSIFLQAATSSHVGLVTTGTQTFGGNKTFDGTVYIPSGALTIGNDTGGAYIALDSSATGTAVVDFDQLNGTNHLQFDNNTDTFTLKRAGVDQLIVSSTGANLAVGNLSVGTSDTTGQLLVLDTKTGVGDPTGTNGGMYYNSNSGKFRCYQNSAWTDCIGGGITSIGTYGGSIANGLSISGTTLTLGAADQTNPGGVSTNAQTFGGAKTFAQLITGQAGISTSGGAVTLQGNAASSLTTTSGALTITSAAAATWSTGAGILTLSGNGGLTAGTNTQTGASSAVTILTGNSTSAGNTGAITLTTGQASSGTAGSISLDIGAGTTGTPGINLGTANNYAGRTITLGGTTQTGAITLGQSTATNTISIGNANTATGSTQTINIGAGTPAGTGLTNINIGNLINGGSLSLRAGTGNINLQTGGNVTIGTSNTTGTLLVLDTKTDSGDPTGVNGGIYYNSNSGKFRCYQNGSWMDCVAASGGFVSLQNAYDNSTGGTTPEIKLDSTRGGLDIQDANTTISGNLLTVRASNGSGLGSALFNVNSTGQVALQNSADSEKAFQLLTSSGTNLVSVSTNSTKQNLIYNSKLDSSFEGSYSNWKVRHNATATVVSSQANFGLYSLELAGGTTQYNGISYYYPLKASTQYTMSMYLKTASGSSSSWTPGFAATPYSTGTAGTGGVSSTTLTGAGTTWTAAMVGSVIRFTDGQERIITARASNTSITLSSAITLPSLSLYEIETISDCGSAPSITTTWTQFTCTFTTGATIGNYPHIYLRHNNTTSDTVYIDGFTLVTGATGLAYVNPGSQLEVEPSAGGTLRLLGQAGGELSSWQEGTALPSRRATSGVTYFNGYAYVVGGNLTGSGAQSTVYYARVNTDGSMGAWATTTALPAGEDLGSAVAVNGYMYYIEGAPGATGVLSAKINTDGTLGVWTSLSEGLPVSANWGVTALYANGYLYVVGGSNNTQVFYAQVQAGGSTGPWQATTSLTYGRRDSTGGAVVANGYIYVVGSDFGDNKTEYARINSDGTLSSWTTSTNNLLQNVAEDPSVAVMNGYLYVMGGLNGGSPLNNVQYTKILPDGSIDAWKASSMTLPRATGEAGRFVANGYIYFVGGSTATDAGSAVANVYYASGARVQVGGTLDLVGLQGTNISDANTYYQGGSGGSLIANDGTFVGDVEIAGSLLVGGSFSIDAFSAGSISANEGIRVSSTGSSALTVLSPDGTNLIAVDTRESTGVNLINEASSSFEDGSIGLWRALGTGSVSGTEADAKFGVRSLQIITGTTSGNGAAYPYKFWNDFDYGISVWLKRSTSSTNTINIGYHANGSDTDCLTGQTVTTTWTKYTCTISTGSWPPTNDNYVYIKQTDTTTDTLYLDGFSIAYGTPADYEAPASILQVSAVNQAVNIFTDGSPEPGPWQMMTNPNERMGHGTVYANGFVYILGGQNSGFAAQDDVFYAKVNANGSLGTWNSTTLLPYNMSHFGAAYLNGYIYIVVGTDVYYARVNADGTLGSWVATTNSPSSSAGKPSIAINGVIYTFDDSGNVYSARPKLDGTISSWSTLTALPAALWDGGLNYANGYLYYAGGYDGATGTTDTYYARVNPDGSLGSWTTASNQLPSDLYCGTTAVANGYLYWFGGGNNDCNTLSDFRNYYTKLNSDGSIGQWHELANLMPDFLRWPTSVVINGYLYILAGEEKAGGGVNYNIYYARMGGVVSVNGSIDLIGGQGGNLYDTGGTSTGSVGGSLTAGNGIFVGSLQVQGAVSINQSLNVQGNFVADGAALFRNSVNSTSGFAVQDSSSNNLFVVDTTNSRVHIGSPTADSTGIPLVLDTKNTSGDPTGTDGAMYYNSNSKSFRCYENGVWRSCIGGLVAANTSVPGGNTVTSTTTETNFSSNYSIPADECQPGRVFRVTASGVYTQSSATVTLRFKMGSTVLYAYTTGGGVAYGGTNNSWRGQFEITCDTAGGSGTIEAQGAGFFGTVMPATATTNTSTISMDTTTAQTLQMSAQWSAANSSTITLRQIIVESLGP